MKLNKKTEIRIRKIALKYLKYGRIEWDIPHTLCSVYWIKKIVKKEKGNERILVTAAYLHDIGYSGLFKTKKIGHGNVLRKKGLHMEVGAEIAKKELQKLKYFSKKEIDEICHLVSMHDKLGKIKTKNEILLMESDSLGMIDVKKVTPSFDPENYVLFFNEFKKERLPIIRTKTSKKFLKKLIKNAESYYKKQKAMAR